MWGLCLGQSGRKVPWIWRKTFTLHSWCVASTAHLHQLVSNIHCAGYSKADEPCIQNLPCSILGRFQSSVCSFWPEDYYNYKSTTLADNVQEHSSTALTIDEERWCIPDDPTAFTTIDEEHRDMPDASTTWQYQHQQTICIHVSEIFVDWIHDHLHVCSNLQRIMSTVLLGTLSQVFRSHPSRAQLSYVFLCKGSVWLSKLSVRVQP